MKSLANYLSRVGLTDLQAPYKLNRETLKKVMAAQQQTIAFENIDVVQKKIISMEPEDVEKKLVYDMRGGYCFEQNTLLKMVLEDMGYLSVKPLLCRVKWGKQDTDEPNATFTHLALQVATDDGSFLADVGFAGSNSIEPVRLDVGTEAQELPEGQFHVVPSKHKGYYVLELLVKGEYRPLYEWRDEAAPLVDQVGSNWFSCTFPTARFTSQFFVCRVINDERHHLLNDEYVIQKGYGAHKNVIKEIIVEKARLEALIAHVFGIKLVETGGIDRFLN
jgi:N-hydroxyarylamine O-acetyltransferase